MLLACKQCDHFGNWLHLTANDLTTTGRSHTFSSVLQAESYRLLVTRLLFYVSVLFSTSKHSCVQFGWSQVRTSARTTLSWQDFTGLASNSVKDCNGAFKHSTTTFFDSVCPGPIGWEVMWTSAWTRWRRANSLPRNRTPARQVRNLATTLTWTILTLVMNWCQNTWIWIKVRALHHFQASGYAETQVPAAQKCTLGVEANARSGECLSAHLSDFSARSSKVLSRAYRTSHIVVKCSTTQEVTT